MAEPEKKTRWAKVYLWWFNDRSTGKPISKTAIRVLTALAAYADEKGECFPSIARLVADTQLARSHVSEALADLKARRIVASSRRGPKTSNRYRLECDESRDVTRDVTRPGIGKKKSRNPGPQDVPESGKTLVPESGTQNSPGRLPTAELPRENSPALPPTAPTSGATGGSHRNEKRMKDAPAEPRQLSEAEIARRDHGAVELPRTERGPQSGGLQPLAAIIEGLHQRRGA